MRNLCRPEPSYSRVGPYPRGRRPKTPRGCPEAQTAPRPVLPRSSYADAPMITWCVSEAHSEVNNSPYNTLEAPHGHIRVASSPALGLWGHR